ncbi:unnamed protein product [Amoebophrya sp. A25]|nr:unnamed protein product [Amoebophrya sp. A25]|eukprot:GSA25T00024137001.1
MSSSVLSQMKVLDLSNQRLKDLADVRFATLFPHLRKLVLDGNSSLTEVNFSLEALQRGFNLIYSAPLQKLVKLCLNGCARLHPSRLDLGGVPGLETLELSNMGLTDLSFVPDSLGQQRNLKILRLGKNEFQSIPDGCFAHLKALQFLDMSQNKLRVIEPDKAFLGLTELRELHLEENRLPAFGQSDAIQTQGYIVTKNGVINYFAEDKHGVSPNGSPSRRHTWFRTVRLKVLNLAFNRIQELRDVGRISELRGLHTVSLVNNPFSRKNWYRYQLINHCPNLRAIDSVPITQEETERVAALVRQHLENNPTAAMAVVTVDALLEQPGGGLPQNRQQQLQQQIAEHARQAAGKRR